MTRPPSAALRARLTLAGLLLVGKEAALRKYLPAHEIAFQVLHGSDVRVNEFRRWPLSSNLVDWYKTPSTSSGLHPRPK